MLWKPSAHTAGGQTDSRGRRAAYRTIQLALHVPASTQIFFFLGGLPSRMLKSLLCTPAAGHTLGRKLLHISRRQNSNRIVSLSKIKYIQKSLPVSETVFKMSSMLLSLLPAALLFELDFPDNLDASTNYLAKTGLLAGGLLLWQFLVKKKSLQNPKRANRLLTGW